MRVLVVAAHPDDEVYGMGGTIAKLSSQGHEVHVLIVTDGCTAQYAGRPDLPEIIPKKTGRSTGSKPPSGCEADPFWDFPGYAAGHGAP